MIQNVDVAIGWHSCQRPDPVDLNGVISSINASCCATSKAACLIRNNIGLNLLTARAMKEVYEWHARSERRVW